MDNVEGNKIIAEFMGCKIRKDGKVVLSTPELLTGECLSKPKYHYSWDWLMPVVHKAYEITTEDEQQFAGLTLFEIGLPTPINEIWQYITEFIQWYNTQNKQLNLE